MVWTLSLPFLKQQIFGFEEDYGIGAFYCWLYLGITSLHVAGKSFVFNSPECSCLIFSISLSFHMIFWLQEKSKKIWTICWDV